MSSHWNENVVILTKFSSLAALEVVILTTFSAASDENFIKMKTFPFQCCKWLDLNVLTTQFRYLARKLPTPLKAFLRIISLYQNIWFYIYIHKHWNVYPCVCPLYICLTIHKALYTYMCSKYIILLHKFTLSCTFYIRTHIL